MFNCYILLSVSTRFTYYSQLSYMRGLPSIHSYLLDLSRIYSYIHINIHGLVLCFSSSESPAIRSCQAITLAILFSTTELLSAAPRHDTNISMSYHENLQFPNPQRTAEIHCHHVLRFFVASHLHMVASFSQSGIDFYYGYTPKHRICYTAHTLTLV